MKFGDRFETESVPEWSLHNIDYNSLKHYIKVHTTRDQATAIAIPGHQDTDLAKFEAELYLELCRQHDRVDLFVSSKADELSRRLQHLSNQVHRLVLRCATSSPASSPGRMPLKRQRRLARYQRDLAGCDDDIRALSRFIGAQVEAFRKILKKYRKWTGSPILGSRFKDNVLSHPKSFTRRDFSHLRLQYGTVSEALQAAIPGDTSRATSPSLPPATPPTYRNDAHSGDAHSGAIEALATASNEACQDPDAEDQQGYWNEYEHGSEAGDIDKHVDGSYAIYIDPTEDVGFPGMATLVAMFQVPVEKARTWLGRGHAQVAPGPEHGPLLTGGTYGYGSAQASYRSSIPDDSSSATDTEAEDGPSRGPRSHTPGWRRASYPTSDAAAPLPTVDDQRVVARYWTRYRARVLSRATLGAFAVSFVFLGLTGVLIATGRNKMRAEVDAGVAVGAMASLACACAALSMNVTRANAQGWGRALAVWGAFATVCVLNGVLLVLVVGRAGL